MPLLTFYDYRIILQTVLNTEGQHANVTNVLRFSCYSCNTHEYMQTIYADLIFKVQYGSHKSLQTLVGHLYAFMLKSHND